jgi:hypothetical protein
MQVFLLSLEAALYPTLLAAVVILLAQPRPRRLLAAYLAGGFIISISAGLVIVFALSDSHAVSGGGSVLSWGGDLALGGLAVLAAVALSMRADEHFKERRARRKAEKPPKPAKEKKEPWSERILSRGSVPIVFAAGLAINVPGAAYLIALKEIAGDGHPAATQVLIILGFNVVMFALAEIPLVGLVVAPERTSELVARTNAWLSGHGRQIATGLSAFFGVYLIARGIVNS